MKTIRSLKIKILRLVKQQVYITVSYFLEFYYYRLVEEKDMVSKRPGHFPFLLKLFSSIFFCKGYTFFPKKTNSEKHLCYKSEHVVLFLSCFCFPLNLDNAFIPLSSDIHYDQCIIISFTEYRNK